MALAAKPEREGPDRAVERSSPGHGPAPRTRLHAPSTVSLSHGSTFLVAAEYGDIRSDHHSPQGLYCEDTRFLSQHELRVNGRPLECVASSLLSHRHARWTYLALGAASMESGTGNDRVSVTVDRLVSARRMHEDIVLDLYGGGPASLLLTLALSTDFADIFEVRSRRWQRRLGLSTIWHGPDCLDTRYQRNGFVRRCVLHIAAPPRAATYANGALHFPVDLAGGGRWRVCLQYDLVTSARERPAVAACPLANPSRDRAERARQRWLRTAARLEATDLRLRGAFQQATEDFSALRLYDSELGPDAGLPAAGIPWFMAVFGRDSIIASLQALPAHPLLSLGTLHTLARWQADAIDDRRDAEPGKICHELRVGEWAHFGTIPHTPYYGTADATPLYLVLLGEAFRWLGSAGSLARFRDTAERCLQWIDRHGDRDGDGLQEYAPRTPEGYRNQCWRDAGEGVLDETGDHPPHPIGTCELQAYVYLAKLGVAPLFEAWGEELRAHQLRREARELRRRFLEAFWLPEGGLAFALDGAKRAVTTVTSNPGHCLWAGILDGSRGRSVARRLMQPDLFTGWGLRTLSSDHPAFDPHSYQRGSVWPHDTMIAAAGLRRYGLIEQCWQLIDGTLAAAACFDRLQLPELFGGLTRQENDVPVPYPLANVPQAWAAGAVFHAVRILLGLEPDLPSGRVYLDPALPPWCPSLRLDNVMVGPHRLSIRAQRAPDGETDVSVAGGGLRVVRGPAPWLEIEAD